MSKNNITILAVDDDPVMLELLHRILTEDKYTCLTATSGLEALEVLKTQYIDLLVTGIFMPHMGGDELLERIRPQYPDLPVIIVTACENEVIIEGCMQLGVESYIRKPFEIEALRVEVQKALAD